MVVPSNDDADPRPDTHEPDRRDVLAKVSSIAMTGGLVVSYGTAGAIAGRYLYPSEPREERWLYVTTVKRLAPGESMPFRTPLGATVTVARQSAGESEEDFVALSSTCPHLGCQVHWQRVEQRFFCPCHNGVFDPSGRATSGPPADAGQSLPRFPLRVERGLLYIRVPIDGVA